MIRTWPGPNVPVPFFAAFIQVDGTALVAASKAGGVRPMIGSRLSKNRFLTNNFWYCKVF